VLYIKAGAASINVAGFMHWLVRLVRGLYGPSSCSGSTAHPGHLQNISK